jgi:hypothetical protein
MFAFAGTPRHDSRHSLQPRTGCCSTVAMPMTRFVSIPWLPRPNAGIPSARPWTTGGVAGSIASERPGGSVKLLRVTAALAASLSASMSCSGQYVSAERLWRGPTTLVRVMNQNWMDVTVFVVRGATRTRIGFVNALSEATFPLSAAAAPDGSLRLLLDPLGSAGTYMTEAIAVRPGQQVELTITPSLGMSYLAVWGR